MIKLIPIDINSQQCVHCSQKAAKASEFINLYRLTTEDSYIIAEVYYPECAMCRRRKGIANFLGIALILMLVSGILLSYIKSTDTGIFGIVMMALLLSFLGVAVGAFLTFSFSSIFFYARGMKDENTHKILELMKKKYRWQEKDPKEGYIIEKTPMTQEDLINIIYELEQNYGYKVIQQ